MSEDKDAYWALKIASEAKSAAEETIACLTQSGIFKLCYAYKARVKKERDILDKVYRKIHYEKKVDYNYSKITDIIGLRFITLFREDLEAVFTKIFNIINHDDSVSPNIFIKSYIKEIIVYYTDLDDPVIDFIENIAIKNNIKDKFSKERSKRQYSSIHIVTMLLNKISDVPYCETTYHIPVEIQIRTVFEDAWGEVDHKYGYRHSSGKDAVQDVKLSDVEFRQKESIQRHLVLMKKFIDNCSSYAELIRKESNHSINESVAKIDVDSVPTDESLTKVMQDIGVDAVTLKKYTEARSLRKIAEDKESKGRGNGESLFYTAANKFYEIAPRVEIFQIDHTQRLQYVLYYYCMMNYAVCHLSINNREHVEKALKTYKVLEGVYPESPLVKMRIGQAYGKLKLNQKAITKFEEAKELLCDYSEGKKTNEDIMPEIDIRFMNSKLPKLLGYQYWVTSEEIPTTLDGKLNISGIEKKLSILTNECLKSTDNIMPLDTDDEIAKINNKIYYLIEIDNLRALTTPDYKRVNIADVTSELDKLVHLLDINATHDTDYLDTYIRAKIYLEDIPEALRVAKLIIPIAKESLSKHPFNAETIQNALDYAECLIKG